MSQIIKKFSDFHHVDEGAMDFLTDLVKGGDNAITDVIKGKVSDYLVHFFGVKPESIFGTILRNFAETVDVSDLYDFITKGEGNISVRTLAPRLADVTIETLTEMGIDGIAGRFGIEDKNGWIYRTIKEMISNSSKKAQFRDNIENFWTMILTSISGGETKSPFQTVKSGENPFRLTQSEERKISSDPEVKQAAEKSGMNMSDLLKSMTSASTNPKGPFGTVGGQ
jgi:hypothetical protein